MISFEAHSFRHKTQRGAFHVFFLNWSVKKNDLGYLFPWGEKITATSRSELAWVSHKSSVSIAVGNIFDSLVPSIDLAGANWRWVFFCVFFQRDPQGEVESKSMFASPVFGGKPYENGDSLCQLLHIPLAKVFWRINSRYWTGMTLYEKCQI